MVGLRTDRFGCTLDSGSGLSALMRMHRMMIVSLLEPDPVSPTPSPMATIVLDINLPEIAFNVWQRKYTKIVIE